MNELKNKTEESPRIFVEKLVFNDDKEMQIGHSEIVIFTGANNAGKSQVLKDIDSLGRNTGVKGIVLSSLVIEFYGNIVLKAQDFQQKDGRYRVSNSIFMQIEDIMNVWNSKDPLFVPYFMNILNTESRLQASNNSKSFDALNQNPTTPVQMLYVDDQLAERISQLFQEAFNEHLIVNHLGGNTIPVHVGQPPKMEEGEDRVSKGYFERLNALPVLQNQGDGMRSFAGILFDVFTTQKTITMIDEPEAFLHPPQARLLGRMLVKNKPNDRQLFISTHSEDFLKGLLDADSDCVRIVRIDRQGSINHIQELDNNGVKMLWNDSILRYSNILSGLFHSKVVICESDTDCRFYQAMLDALYERKGLVSPDILFTHCGGKERLKTVIPALKSLNVKTVVVTDIDVLNKEDTFMALCNQMDIEWDAVKGKWKTVFEYVKSQRAQLDTDEVKKDIESILNAITTPQLSNDDIEAIKEKLKASTAWSKVKQVGKQFFNGPPYIDLDDLMKLCKEKGLFIVPVGELESFYKPLASSSNHGSKWVNAVMRKDLVNDPELEEARRFVSDIASF